MELEDVYKTTDKINRFDPDGREILNPTPMQPPLGYKKTLSLAEQIRQQIKQFKALQDDDPETEEEADDFEIEDEEMLVSRWENDMIPSIKETRARAREIERQAALYAAPPQETPSPEPEPTPEPKIPSKQARTFWPTSE